MTDPEKSARKAGLIYLHDSAPGIHRRRCGQGFCYVDPDGNFITDDESKRRFEALAIPPAYTDVWIAPDPQAHLQATGRDEQGRKQYVYHPDWHRVRQETKFNHLIDFGEALPDLRARIDQDLRLRKLSREKVLAAAIRLMDRALLRVGNDAYARTNGSHGLTTLEDDHVDFMSNRIELCFNGKGGKTRAVQLADRRLARIVRRCRDLPGQRLFQYLDDAGEQRSIQSTDVNAYLRETMGEGVSAKSFRTWGGTVCAATELCNMVREAEESAQTKQVNEAIARVAAQLGNTKAVCRSHYVHPRVLTAFTDGSLHEAWSCHIDTEPPPGLEPCEYATLQFLKARA